MPDVKDTVIFSQWYTYTESSIGFHDDMEGHVGEKAGSSCNVSLVYQFGFVSCTDVPVVGLKKQLDERKENSLSRSRILEKTVDVKDAFRTPDACHRNCE